MKALRMLNILAVLLLLAAVLPAQPAQALPPAVQEVPEDALVVPGEVVVTFPEGWTASTYSVRVSALARTVGAAVVRRYRNTALLSFSPEADVTALAGQIASVARVQAVQPNYVYRFPESAADLNGEAYSAEAYSVELGEGGTLTLSWDHLKSLRTASGTVQGSPAFPGEIDNAWGWDAVQADIIWNTPVSTANVCLIDSGVDTAHPDLAGTALTGYDYVNNDTIPNDDNGHGTHLAGIITAKANNGAGTAIGVGNTKVLPVKVANAQGLATSFNIAAGLRHCANNTAIKIISLSLGTATPDPLVYSAVQYAVVSKAKLLVAAAGNQSLSYVDAGGGKWRPAFFPAGWANADVDGATGKFNLDGVAYSPSTANSEDNNVFKGVIAVAAASDPAQKAWVDQADFGAISDNELFSDCAWGGYNSGRTSGTNYGNWITLVAPGDAIFSTTPRSYGFYNNYYYSVPASYGVMSGTSQAAAFVAGAASRVWGVYPLMKGEQVKTRLVLSGKPLTHQSDLFQGSGGDGTAFDANQGFNNDSDFIRHYGETFSRDDPDLPPPHDTYKAPFCWPDNNAPFGSLQDMRDARYLNVAAAMARVGYFATVRDAKIGMPLDGASVRAAIGVTQKALALVPKNLTRTAPAVALINVPVDIVATPSCTPACLPNSYVPKNTNFNLQVSKTGFTTGFQTYNTSQILTGWAGTGAAPYAAPMFANLGKFYAGPYDTVSLVSSTNIHAVVDWVNPAGANANLDAYLWLPKPNFKLMGGGTGGGVVGVPDTVVNFSALTADYLGGGTLADAAKIGGGVVMSPYAFYNFNGGMDTGALDEGNNPIYTDPLEAISIRASTVLTTTAPYLQPVYAGTYTFFVTADGAGWLNKSHTTFKPVVRVWAKGYIIKTINLADSSGTSCDGTKAWWKVFTYNGFTVTAANTCGTDASWPY